MRNLTLTEGADSSEGNEGEADDFYAPLTAVEGQAANTLNSADELDGVDSPDGESNTLTAEVMPETDVGSIGGLGEGRPISPETSNIEEMFFEAQQGGGDDRQGVTINAAEMEDVNQWWSEGSQSDLTIEKASRTERDEGVTEDVTIGMRDTVSDGAAPAENASDFSVFFDEPELVGGEHTEAGLARFSIAHEDTAPEAPLQEVREVVFEFEADGEQFSYSVDTTNMTTTTELFNAMREEVGDDFDVETGAVADRTGEEWIEFSDPEGRELTNQNLDFSAADDASTFDIDSEVTEAQVTPGEVTSPIILDRVGRGSEGGRLAIGSMSDSDSSTGVEVFNIDVQRDSDLEEIVSTNTALDEVNIANDEGHEGDLTVRGGFGDLDSEDFDGNAAYAPTDIDSTGLEGSLTLGEQQVTQAANHDFNFGDGGNNVTMDVHEGLMGEAPTANNNFSLNVNGGSGDDDYVLRMDEAEVGEQAGRNITLDAGNGDNTVVLDGDGMARIESGTGDDAIFTDGHHYVDVPEGGNQTWDLDLEDLAGEYFGAQLRLDLNGVESEWVDIGNDDYVTDPSQLREAIEDAIDSRPELENTLAFDDGSDELTVLAAGDTHEIGLDIRGPLGENLDGADLVEGDVEKGVADGLAPDFNRISEDDIESAWETYFPGSDFGESVSDDNNDFGDGQGDYEGFLEAIQENAEASRTGGSGGDGNDANTSHIINAGKGDDVITLSTNAEDTIELTGSFDRTTVLNAREGDNQVDFSDYLDLDAHERGDSVNEELDGDDAQADEAVRYAFDGGDEIDRTNPNAAWSVDTILDAAYNDNVSGRHNNVETLSFGDLFGDLNDNEDTDEAVTFDELSGSELESIFSEDNGNLITNVPGESDAENASNNEFMILVGHDEQATYDVEDGEMVPDGTDDIDMTEFMAFEAGLSEVTDDNGDVTGHELAGVDRLGVLDLAEGLEPDVPDEPFFDVTLSDETVEADNLPVDIDVDVDNTGGERDTQTIALEVDDELVGEEELELDGGDSGTVTFEDIGDDLEVDDEVELRASSEDDDDTATLSVVDEIREETLNVPGDGTDFDLRGNEADATLEFADEAEELGDSVTVGGFRNEDDDTEDVLDFTAIDFGAEDMSFDVQEDGIFMSAPDNEDEFLEAIDDVGFDEEAIEDAEEENAYWEVELNDLDFDPTEVVNDPEDPQGVIEDLNAEWGEGWLELAA